MSIHQRIAEFRQEYRNMVEYLGADVEAEMEDFDKKLHTLLLAVQDEQKEICSSQYIMCHWEDVDSIHDAIVKAPLAYNPKQEKV